MTFDKTLSPIKNHGSPPKSFLETLLKWGSEASEDIFEPNDEPRDIYASVRPILGEKEDVLPGEPEHYVWNGPLHRRAALLEAIRVHAGLESDWNLSEDVDRSNAASMAHPERAEAGPFQVSFDSLRLDADGSLDACLMRHDVLRMVVSFRSQMRRDWSLALEYYARLVRLNVKWAGPIVRGERWLAANKPKHSNEHGDPFRDNVHENLSVAAMYEIMELLKQVS